MKRLWVLVLLAVITTVGAFATGQDDGGGGGKTVTLKYWDIVNETETKLRYDWTYANIDLFQKANPNIKIEFTNTPNGDQYLNKLSTEMAANNVPDVFMTCTAGRLEPFVKAGRVYALDDIISRSSSLKEVVNPGNCSATTFDGKVYGIPIELAGEVIYYNKKVFRDAGLEPPTTWAELLNCVKVFRAKGIIPFSLSNKDPWPGTIPYMAIFDKLWGPAEYKKAVFQKKALFDGEPYVVAAQYLAELAKAGAFTDNFNSIEYGEASSHFRSGKAAMRYNGTWELPTNITALGDDLGIMNWVAMPNGKGKREEGWLTIQNNAFAIGAASPNKAAAAKFLEFVLSKERQKILAEGGFMIALRNIPFDKAKLHPAAAEVAKQLSSSPNPILIWDVMLGQNVGKELNLATQAILGGADIKSTLSTLNKVARAEWGQ
jgi:raffinose/stachyose/melibiose transport system substrate-binding protein